MEAAQQKGKKLRDQARRRTVVGIVFLGVSGGRALLEVCFRIASISTCAGITRRTSRLAVFDREPDKARYEFDDPVCLICPFLDAERERDHLAKLFAKRLLARQTSIPTIRAEGRDLGAAEKDGVERVDVLAMGGGGVLRGSEDGGQVLV